MSYMSYSIIFFSSNTPNQRRDAELELILMELRMGTRYQRGTIEDHIDWQVGV